MKKLVSLATFGLALASVAAPQKLAEVAVSDRTAILNQASKLGEMTGIPMIGLGAVGLLSANPLAADFGAPRDGAVTTIAVYGDLDVLKSTADVDAFGETLHFAVAYPASADKAAYEAKKSLTATNGVYTADGQVVAYSADGAWAVVGDDADTVRAVIPAAGKAKLTQGELVRVTLTEPAMAGLDKIFEIAAAEIPEFAAQMKAQRVALQQMNDLSIALRVSERGIDLLADMGARPGSEFDKAGRTALPANPLAFAGKEALVAAAQMANCGTDASEKQWKSLIEFFAGRGLTLDFVSFKKEGKVCRFEIDPQGVVDFVKKGDAEKWVKALDDESFEKELETLVTNVKPYTAAGAEAYGSVAIKGRTLASTPAVRFAKAMPEVRKPFYSVTVMSLYGALREATEATLKVMPASAGVEPEQVEMVRGVLQTLPAAGDGCFTMTAWREGTRHCFLMRATPEEVKGLAAVGKLAASAVGSVWSPGSGFGEELPPDEDDDDDDDDDEDED